MNHFEFGFFDELEKIATNPDVVAQWRKMFDSGSWGKNLSKRDRGDASNFRSQMDSVTPRTSRGLPPLYSHDPAFVLRNPTGNPIAAAAVKRMRFPQRRLLGEKAIGLGKDNWGAIHGKTVP
jgi:hypothetical protein